MPQGELMQNVQQQDEMFGELLNMTGLEIIRAGKGLLKKKVFAGQPWSVSCH